MVLKKIGLTGATGMLGRHLDKALRYAGAEVVPVSRSATLGDVSACWDLAEWRELEALDALFPNVEAVIHAGAFVQTSGTVDEARMFDINVRACVNLGQWALVREVPIVFVSSGTVYANPASDNLGEESPLGWSELGGFYGLTKLLAEDVFNRLRLRGLQRAVVRPSALYGFGIPKSKMIYKFLDTARHGGTIDLTQPVNDRVDFVHAADLSRAIIKILERKCWDTFNVASGAPISLKELAEACVKLTGQGSVRIAQGDTPEREPLQRFFLKTELAQHYLDWRPEIDMMKGLNMVLNESLLALPASVHGEMCAK